jgi:hypothetical protein
MFLWVFYRVEAADVQPVKRVLTTVHNNKEPHEQANQVHQAHIKSIKRKSSASSANQAQKRISGHKRISGASSA